MAQDDVTVYAFNGNSADNFHAYFAQQAPTFVVPQTTTNPDGTRKIIGSPVPSLTNTQTWATYGIAIAGAIAPCTTGRPNPQDVVGGFACSF